MEQLPCWCSPTKWRFLIGLPQHTTDYEKFEPQPVISPIKILVERDALESAGFGLALAYDDAERATEACEDVVRFHKYFSNVSSCESLNKLVVKKRLLQLTAAVCTTARVDYVQGFFHIMLNLSYLSPCPLLDVHTAYALFLRFFQITCPHLVTQSEGSCVQQRNLCRFYHDLLQFHAPAIAFTIDRLCLTPFWNIDWFDSLCAPRFHNSLIWLWLWHEILSFRMARCRSSLPVFSEFPRSASFFDKIDRSIASNLSTTSAPQAAEIDDGSMTMPEHAYPEFLFFLVAIAEIMAGNSPSTTSIFLEGECWDAIIFGCADSGMPWMEDSHKRLEGSLYFASFQHLRTLSLWPRMVELVQQTPKPFLRRICSTLLPAANECSYGLTFSLHETAEVLAYPKADKRATVKSLESLATTASPSISRDDSGNESFISLTESYDLVELEQLRSNTGDTLRPQSEDRRLSFASSIKSSTSDCLEDVWRSCWTSASTLCAENSFIWDSSVVFVPLEEKSWTHMKSVDPRGMLGTSVDVPSIHSVLITPCRLPPGDATLQSVGVTSHNYITEKGTHDMRTVYVSGCLTATVEWLRSNRHSLIILASHSETRPAESSGDVHDGVIQVSYRSDNSPLFDPSPECPTIELFLHLLNANVQHVVLCPELKFKREEFATERSAMKTLESVDVILPKWSRRYRQNHSGRYRGKRARRCLLTEKQSTQETDVNLALSFMETPPTPHDQLMPFQTFQLPSGIPRAFRFRRRAIAPRPKQKMCREAALGSKNKTDAPKESDRHAAASNSRDDVAAFRITDLLSTGTSLWNRLSAFLQPDRQRTKQRNSCLVPPSLDGSNEIVVSEADRAWGVPLRPSQSPPCSIEPSAMNVVSKVFDVGSSSPDKVHRCSAQRSRPSYRRRRHRSLAPEFLRRHVNPKMRRWQQRPVDKKAESCCPGQALQPCSFPPCKMFPLEPAPTLVKESSYASYVAMKVSQWKQQQQKEILRSRAYGTSLSSTPCTSVPKSPEPCRVRMAFKLNRPVPRLSS